MYFQATMTLKPGMAVLSLGGRVSAPLFPGMLYELYLFSVVLLVVVAGSL